jgi:hypothetical protein
MNKPQQLTLACFLLCSSLAAVGQAQNASVLQPGTSIERELGSGQVHTFSVKLEENNLIQFVVEQRGIDVVVKVVSPAGKTIGDYDTPNGAEGPENVSFVALVSGSYSITVQPLNPVDTPKGRYLIKILEVRAATEQEQRTSKNREIVKAKGIELLKNLDGQISQVKAPLTRIKAQLQAADLLWDDEEKISSKYLSDAIAGLKEFITSCDENDQEYAQQYSVIVQIRYEIAQLLAETDADAALNFLSATVPPANPYNPREQPSQESTLELAIASHIMARDPKRALQIARRGLKQGYSAELVRVVSELRQKNSELATELAGEITAKLLNEKLIRNSEAAQLAVSLINFSRRQSIALSAGGDEPRDKTLPDETYKELLQKIFTEVLSYSPTQNHPHNPEREIVWNMLTGLHSMGADLDKTISGGSAAVAKKHAEIIGPSINIVNTPPLVNLNLDEARAEIEKAPPEERERRYIELASREAANGETAKAREIINDHVTNPYQRRQWLQNVEQQEIHRAANTGKVEEALRIISGLRTNRERGVYLGQIAGNIGPGLKRATALNLLEQARALLPPSAQAQDQDQMNALLEIARAFSRYDSKRAFEIIEPLIEQFNDICTAARALEGFGGEFYNDEELDLNNGNSVSNTASQMTSVLGALAFTNFERAKATSDRIRLPEIRLKAYLDIAQKTIQAEQ